MALNMATDEQFDEALNWLAELEKKTKSDVIRELVIERFASKREGFHFGALAHLFKKTEPKSKKIQADLKAIDQDHDLD